MDTVDRGDAAVVQGHQQIPVDSLRELRMGTKMPIEDTLNPGSVGGIAGHAQRLWNLKNTPVSIWHR